MASGNIWSEGELDQRHENCYATIFYASYGPQGIIEQESTPHRNA